MDPDSPPVPPPIHLPASGAPPAAFEWIAVALGGSIGAMLRFAVIVGLEANAAHPALATFVVNLSGAFGLGLLFSWVEHRGAHPLTRPFLVIGVLGSFTTFSALVFENRNLASTHDEIVSMIHLTLSIAVGLLAFVVGSRAAALLGAREDPGSALRRRFER